MGWWGRRICSNEGPAFSKGRWLRNTKKIDEIKNFSSPEPLPNFNKTWHKVFLGVGVLVFSNEGPHLFSRGDDYEIAKMHWRNLKIFFWPISTNLGTMHSSFKRIQVCSNEEAFNSHKVNNGFFLLLIKIIIIFVRWFELSSQLSDVKCREEQKLLRIMLL